MVYKIHIGICIDVFYVLKSKCKSITKGGNAVAVYRIADINIKYKTSNSYLLNILKPFITENDSHDHEIKLSVYDIDNENKIYPEKSMSMLESRAFLRKICTLLIEKYEGMFLHCAAIKYNGKAYLFTAPSGTGKTTHIRLWKKHLGDKVEIINGDKPLLRKIGNEIIAYGTPWQGKEDYGCNTSAPIGGIFLIHRAEENSIVKATVKESLPFLLSQTVRPYEKENLIKLFDVLEYMVNNIPIYNLYCNMDKQAMETALSVVE